jgi:hypothetical protein
MFTFTNRFTSLDNNSLRAFSTSSVSYVQGESSNSNNNPSTEELLNDPYKTYGESPIPSDIEESTSELALRFASNKSGFIEYQKNKMIDLLKKSQAYIAELISDRLEERATIQESTELKDFDSKTVEHIELEKETSIEELLALAMVRDTTLDLIGKAHEGSDYDSDYESVSSRNRLDQEYNNFDSNDETQKLEHIAWINDRLATLPRSDSVSEDSGSDDPVSEDPVSDDPVFSDMGSEESILERASSNTGVVEAGSNNNSKNTEVDTIVASSSKRKRELSDSNGDESIVTKKPRLDPSIESPGDTAPVENRPVDNRSPLDYVLDLQQSEPYDFTDDIE